MASPFDAEAVALKAAEPIPVVVHSAMVLAYLKPLPPGDLPALVARVRALPAKQRAGEFAAGVLCNPDGTRPISDAQHAALKPADRRDVDKLFRIACDMHGLDPRDILNDTPDPQ